MRQMDFDPSSVTSSEPSGATVVESLGETIEAMAQPFAQVPHFAGLCVKPA